MTIFNKELFFRLVFLWWSVWSLNQKPVDAQDFFPPVWSDVFPDIVMADVFVLRITYTRLFCVFTYRDPKIITEVVKVTGLQENPSVGPKQGWCRRHSLQLLLREVNIKKVYDRGKQTQE